MSLALIEAEIRRFLMSTDPQVLCIKGRWGVGKTYAWKNYLKSVQHSNSLGFKAYSYVSLFGLNSLEDLRFSIFESTVNGDNVVAGPDMKTFEALFSKGTNLGRKARPWIDMGLAVFNRKGIGEALYKTAFLSVRNQMICLDDLERAGSGLSTRDVLGLASFLKEERKCSVVLLLNDEKMDDNARKEFNKQLEKVADTTLYFNLSAEEAVEIALPNGGPLVAMIGPLLIELGVTNIRVIKKIERLAKKLSGLLQGFDSETVASAVTTLVLAGWSVQQPDTAPPLDFIRDYNRMADRDEVDAQTKEWRRAIQNYPYSSTDELDEVVIDGAVAGYFDADRLKSSAEKIQAQRRETSHDNAFNRAWDELYHGTLAGEDSEFLDTLHLSAIEDAKVISPLNINSAIRLLRENKRSAQADEVIEKYMEAKSDEPLEFFNIANHHFTRGDALDQGLAQALARRRESYVDNRKPLDVLRSMGKQGGWKEADIQLMAKQTVDDFEQMFEALRGDELRPSIEILLTVGRSQLEKSNIVLTAATDALKRIAAKSPLRARKVARFGVVLDVPTAEIEAPL